MAKTFFITEKSETNSTYEDKGKYFLLFLQVNDFFLLKVCYYDKVSNIFKGEGYFGQEIPKSRNPSLVTLKIFFLQVLDDDPLPVPVMKEKPSKFLLLAHRMIKKPIILNVGGYR